MPPSHANRWPFRHPGEQLAAWLLVGALFALLLVF